MHLDILKGTAEQAHQVSTLIPEFDPPKYRLQEYLNRTSGVSSLILIAYHQEQPVGFKVGYKRDDDGSFYSWMGGVVPDYRRHQVAQQLADHQEKWARSQGYKTLRFKTWNRHAGMLIFGLKNGFKVVGVIPHHNIDDYRVWMEKKIAC